MHNALSLDILKEDIRYNDDIEYDVGDDIYQPIVERERGNIEDELGENPSLPAYDRYIVEKLGLSEYSPKIITEDIPLETNDLSYITSISTNDYYDFNNEILKDFQNIKIFTEDPMDEETYNLLIHERYDGIRYYAQTDTLVIPAPIKKHIDDGETVKAKVTLYNMDMATVKHQIFKYPSEQYIKPKVEFQYLPKTVKWSKLTEEKFGEFTYKDNPNFTTTYLYKNMPREYLKQMVYETEVLTYDLTDKAYYCHANANFTKASLLVKDCVENGLKRVIQLKLTPDGVLRPYYSNKRILSALYTNVPTIPVCIMMNTTYLGTYDLYYNPPVNKDLINKLVNPHITIL